MTTPAAAAARPVTRGGPTPMELLIKARWWATKKLPYLAKGLYACQYILTDAVPTMAIDDRWRVYVNPAHIAECMAEDFECLITGVIHECLHTLRRHRTRGIAFRAVNHAKWNKCGDCELVQDIQAAGIKIWSKDLTPERLGWPAHKSAEEYYRLDDDGKDGGGAMCSGGSGVTGVPGPWELPPDPTKGPKGLTEAETEIVRVQVAHAIREHHKGQPGNVAAGLLRWAEEFLAPPHIDWRDMIAGRVRYHIETRLGPVASYARPSRRENGGLVLPVHRTPRANVTIVGDTSASMDDTDIGKVIGVVWDAVQVLGTVKALGCDTQAAEPVDIAHIDDLRDALRGGGGTNMCVGIECAEQTGADVIVVVTDGGTGWPATPPNCPVVVVLTRQGYGTPPPWADVIDASDIATQHNHP